MDFTGIIITAGSFIAAYVNAVFATGGIYIVLAATSSVLPLTVTVPLQPAIVYASLIARITYFRSHISRPIVLAFGSGSVLGVFLGARVFISLSEAVLSLLLGGMMLLIIWLPRFRWRLPVRHPFIPIGFVHSFLTTVVGSAPILQAVLLRTPLLKLQITSTLAGCFIATETMRIAGYALNGFDYRRYWQYLVLANLAGVAGTWLGKRMTHLISDRVFRIVFKSLISLVALRLLYKAWGLFLYN